MSEEYYKKHNPYRAWAYVGERKFVVRGKNRADLLDWGRRTHTRIGSETKAGLKKKRTERNPWDITF